MTYYRAGSRVLLKRGDNPGGGTQTLCFAKFPKKTHPYMPMYYLDVFLHKFILDTKVDQNK